jgi:hypothetical protein
MSPVLRNLGALALAAWAAGCVTSRDYVVDGAQLSSQAEILPGARAKDGRPVGVRAWTIDRASASDAGAGRVKVTARALNRKLIAGSVLTWVGTAISITGTAMLVASWNDHGPLYTTGWVLAPVAEPIMIAGTVLWILALQHPPMETR